MVHAGHMEHLKYNEFRRFMNTVSDGNVKIENSQQAGRSWADDFEDAAQAEAAASSTVEQDSDWVRDFAEHKAKQGEFYHENPFFLSNDQIVRISYFLLDTSNEEFNKQFWNRLQDEWKKISDGLDEQSPWLAEFSEYYDPYTVMEANNEKLLLYI